MIDPLNPFRPAAAAFRAAGQVGDLSVHGRRAVAGRHVRLQARAAEAQRPAVARVAPQSRRSNAVRQRHAWLRRQTARPARSSGAIRRDRACGSANCSRTSPARRRPVLHPLDAGRLEQSRPGQLPAAHRRHAGGKASLGSWTTYGLGSENQDCPATWCCSTPGRSAAPANYSNGFLPAAFQPTRLRDKGTPVLDLLPPERIRRRAAGVAGSGSRTELRHRESRAGFTELDARLASYELAYRMQSARWKSATWTRNAATQRELWAGARRRAHAQLRSQVPAGAAARGARRAIRAALRHARQRWLGRARQAARTTTRRGLVGPISRSRHCWPI